MEEMWLARDKDETLWLFLEKPTKKEHRWMGNSFEGTRIGFLPDTMFPEVQWSDDEPTKVKLVIDK